MRNRQSDGDNYPLQLSFKRGHGVGFYEFYEFFPFRIFIKTARVWEIWRYRRASRNPREKLHRMGWVPIDLNLFEFFGHFSAYFSLLYHYISSPGTSENHRKTCGKVSWRYGYDPVHITYPSTRNTSENRRSNFAKNLANFANNLTNFAKKSRKRPNFKGQLLPDAPLSPQPTIILYMYTRSWQGGYRPPAPPKGPSATAGMIITGGDNYRWW